VIDRVESLGQANHTKTVVKRARQNLFPFRRLKRFGMGPQILKKLYSYTIESILTGCITAWYDNCSASDHKALQRVVRTAQYITGAKFPAIQDLCQRKAQKFVRESSHPNYRLCYRTASGTGAPSLGPKWLLNGFYPPSH
jgi:hypothetical protein